MNFLDELTDENLAHKYNDQGSEDWEMVRLGRFTSSEIWRIMTFGKRDMTAEELKARPKTGKGSKTTKVTDFTKIGPAGESYIRQKVAEVLTGIPKRSSYAYPLVYGKEMEPKAVEHFEKITGLKTEMVGFQVYTDHAGGSPDRLIPEIKAGLELKCPLEDEIMVNYLMLTDWYDLKNMYPDFFYQCTSLMMFTGMERWIWGAYNPRMQDERHQFKRIDIEAKDVQEDFDELSKAIEAAVKEKLQLLHILNVAP